VIGRERTKGAPIRAPFSHLVHVEGECISRVQVFLDRAAADRALEDAD